MTAAESHGWGAYGWRLAPTPSTRWLVPAPADWATVTLRTATGRAGETSPTRDVSVQVHDSRVRIETATGWRLELDLDRARATYRGMPLNSPELVHPGLAATAAILSWARGRTAFHAGGFVAGGRAWAVVGDREAGKTTLLRALAERATPILSDDLVVVDGTDVFAGPRCLDLREPAPGWALPTTAVRDGLRHRLTLGPVPPRVPLAGWIFLAWGDDRIETVPLRDRLALLAPAAAWLVGSHDPEQLLRLAALPTLRFTRPRDAGQLRVGADRLLAAVN